MKVMVGVILACFVFDLVAAKPDVAEVFAGFVPQIPEKFKSELLDTAITNPVFLIAGLLGTTFSVAAL